MTDDPSQGSRRRVVLLVDNGSSRGESTRTLRRLARGLAERLAEPVNPVSLLHADKVPATELDGTPADTFKPFVARRLAAGDRHFLVIPLFFGPSRALTEAIPEWAAAYRAHYGPFELRIAPPLCPLPEGEPRLAEILRANLADASEHAREPPRCVVLVDHGSPIPEVTAVRRWLAAVLRVKLGPHISLSEAAMERRPGPEYDFNGDRLDEALTRLAAAKRAETVFLLPLFLSAGRHAGPGGDIETTVQSVKERHPRLRIVQADLVGSHPDLIEILASRARMTG